MKSRNWVYLFITTLAIGGISTVIIGFGVKWDEYSSLFTSFNLLEILSVAIWLLGVGFIFSLISQMGFFAYLTVHRFGLGLFKSFWNSVQIVLIAFVLFDLVYFRYVAYGEGQSLITYIIPAVLLLIYGIIIAYWKMKETNRGAFIPALFFMIAVTTLEWVPALRADDESWLLLMVLPLLICNTWQLIILHRITKPANS